MMEADAYKLDEWRERITRDTRGIVALILECNESYARKVAEEIAERINLPGTIYHWMIDSRGFHPDNAKRLCDALRACGFDIPKHEGGMPGSIPNHFAIENFIERDGIGCPRCGADADPEGGSFDCDSGFISQDMECPRCGAEWQAMYKLDSIPRIRSDPDSPWIDPQSGEEW